MEPIIQTEQDMKVFISVIKGALLKKVGVKIEAINGILALAQQGIKTITYHVYDIGLSPTGVPHFTIYIPLMNKISFISLEDMMSILSYEEDKGEYRKETENQLKQLEESQKEMNIVIGFINECGRRDDIVMKMGAQMCVSVFEQMEALEPIDEWTLNQVEEFVNKYEDTIGYQGAGKIWNKMITNFKKYIKERDEDINIIKPGDPRLDPINE